ncbi:MAG: SDR family NAD(P)-dependent oxidoreductase [Geminicoccaceae bacterium]
MTDGKGILTGKVAIVTGGSRGIGAAVAIRLAAAGAHVTLTYNSAADKAADVATACADAGGSGEAVQADAGDVPGARTLVDRVVQEKGRLDILVNNAAILAGADLLSVTEEEFDRSVQVNLKGAYFLTKAAAEQMGEGGRVVNIGSIFGESVPYPDLDLYSMSKFAIAGLTRAWARDLAPKKITVNCIQPGPIDTDMNPEDGDLAEAMLPRSPTGRYGRVEEIAEMVAYLVGPNTDNVTSAILNNDGGWNA